MCLYTCKLRVPVLVAVTLDLHAVGQRPLRIISKSGNVDFGMPLKHMQIRRFGKQRVVLLRGLQQLQGRPPPGTRFSMVDLHMSERLSNTKAQLWCVGALVRWCVWVCVCVCGVCVGVCVLICVARWCPRFHDFQFSFSRFQDVRARCQYFKLPCAIHLAFKISRFQGWR